MCASILDIYFSNKPHSVQKQLYEKCTGQLNEKFHRVFKIALKAFQRCKIVLNSSFHAG